MYIKLKKDIIIVDIKMVNLKEYQKTHINKLNLYNL